MSVCRSLSPPVLRQQALSPDCRSTPSFCRSSRSWRRFCWGRRKREYFWSLLEGRGLLAAKRKSSFEVMELELTRWPSCSLRSAAVVRAPAEPGTSSFTWSAQTNRATRSMAANNNLTWTPNWSVAAVGLYPGSWREAQRDTDRVQHAVGSAQSETRGGESAEAPLTLRVVLSWRRHLPSAFCQGQQPKLQFPHHAPMKQTKHTCLTFRSYLVTVLIEIAMFSWDLHKPTSVCFNILESKKMQSYSKKLEYVFRKGSFVFGETMWKCSRTTFYSV